MSIKEIFPLNLNVKISMISNGRNKQESIGNNKLMTVSLVSLIGISDILMNIWEPKKDYVLLL
jgi:hypothetical protein